MKNKILPITLALTLSTVMVTGCGAKEDKKPEEEAKVAVEETVEETKETEEVAEGAYVDGTYDAEAKEANHGWLAKVTVTVEGGEIVEVDYREEAIEDSEDGKVKTGDVKSPENYEYEPNFATVEAVTAAIVENNGIEGIDVDGVTGATNTKGTILELVEEALSTAN